MNPPPTISTDEYKRFIQEFLSTDVADQEWVAQLHKRDEEARGLQCIASITQPQGYILKFADHMRIVWLPQTIHQMMTMYPQQARSIIMHFMLQVHNWQMTIDVPAESREYYTRLEQAVVNVRTQPDPHTQFFIARFNIGMANFFDFNQWLPAEHKVSDSMFVFMYGTGHENEDFTHQFVSYIPTMLEVLDENLPGDKLFRCLFTQVMAELACITVNGNTGVRIDNALVERVRKLGMPLLNQHVNTFLQQLTQLHGNAELSGRIAMALRRMYPDIQINLTADQENRFANFIERHDVK